MERKEQGDRITAQVVISDLQLVSPDQILMIVEKIITIPRIQAVSALYRASREREIVVKLLHLDNQLQINLIT